MLCLKQMATEHQQHTNHVDQWKEHPLVGVSHIFNRAQTWWRLFKKPCQVFRKSLLHLSLLLALCHLIKYKTHEDTAGGCEAEKAEADRCTNQTHRVNIHQNCFIYLFSHVFDSVFLDFSWNNHIVTLFYSTIKSNPWRIFSKYISVKYVVTTISDTFSSLCEQFLHVCSFFCISLHMPLLLRTIRNSAGRLLPLKMCCHG